MDESWLGGLLLFLKYKSSKLASLRDVASQQVSPEIQA
jgi:hypothetical protein